MTGKTILLLTTSLLALSCAKLPSDTPECCRKDYVLSQDGDTRTSVDISDPSRGMISWNEGDRAQFCFDDPDNSVRIASASSSGKSAVFSVAVPSSADNVYVCRMGDPSNSRVSFDTGRGGVSIYFPDEYNGQWTFDEVNALAGYAPSKGSGIKLSPVFGLIEFTLGLGSIGKFVVSCNDGHILANRYLYDFASGSLSAAPGSGFHDSMTFNCGGQAGPFYIPLPAGEYKGGLTLELYDSSSGSLAGIVNVPSITVRKGIITSLGILAPHVGKPCVTLAGDNDRSLICSYGQPRTIRFDASCAWKAEISGGAVLDVTSGPAGNDQSITLTPSPNGSASVYNYRISFVSEDPEYRNFNMSFAQDRKPDYEIVFRNYPDSYSKDKAFRAWTDTEPYGLFKEKFVTNAFGYYTLSQINPSISGEYVQIGLLSNKDNQGSLAYNETGFMLGYSGNNTGGCMVFPAIESRRLSKVEAFMGAASENQMIYLSVMQMDGSVVGGGERQKCGINRSAVESTDIPSKQYELGHDPMSYISFALKGTAVNTPYKLNFSSRAMIRWVTIYYE